ncbi:MAG TPA: SPOR domain-containing protein [Gemmatimonadales bacterium]|nr:SPOR domain-containing protein [Gemmatimonadales bacterium]
MTGRPLPRSRLDALVPSLVTGQALVALVPATGDLRWAAGAAWDVARAAARGERRVALVDLWLEQPTLHEVVGLAPTEGIVDAFEYDVSLTKAAHQVDRVFFIPAGTVTAHAGDLFANPRWKKLHGGFRVEDALLLLYLSAGALARLSTVPDGLIVLSPDGYEPESSIGQGVTAVMERGVTLLGVVRERWTPGASPPSPAVPDRRPSIPQMPARSPVQGPGMGVGARRRTRPVVVAATLAAGAAGSWALLARGAGPILPSAPTRVAAPHAAAPHAPAPVANADSLAWTVQLAAYAGLDKALALGDQLSAAGTTPFVTPVALGGRRGSTVWYRVLVGAYATRDAALAGRATLWSRGLAPQGQGDVLKAPYSLALGRALPADSLRARGIPAVSWDATRLLVGAFETPEQASWLAAQLQRSGITATLVTRMGTTP